MPRRVLHMLSQRPARTGSGVTLEALARCADAAGWEQAAVVGTPDHAHSQVAGIRPDRVYPLIFGNAELPFDIPGMSDVMPYPSTRFGAMTDEQLEQYCTAWRHHLHQAIEHFRPDVIHAHHIWLVSSILKEVAPELPVVVHCHATGLRQMVLCPQLADRVRQGCARCDRFVVLHEGDRAGVIEALGVDTDRVDVVGAGYREDLFHRDGRVEPPVHPLVYAGKYSESKGLDWLLDAAEALGVTLQVAGSGSGAEADRLRARMESMSPQVVLHGQLGQAELAELLRRAKVFVLPSFYEGLPLVLVEALACGCRLVATDLPGVRDQLAPNLGQALERISLPRMIGIDRPDPAEREMFVQGLTRAIGHALQQPPLRVNQLDGFTWDAVFARVAAIWSRCVG